MSINSLGEQSLENRCLRAVESIDLIEKRELADFRNLLEPTKQCFFDTLTEEEQLVVVALSCLNADELEAIKLTSENPEDKLPYIPGIHDLRASMHTLLMLTGAIH